MQFLRVTALTKEGVKNLREGKIVDAVLTLRHGVECLKLSHQVAPICEDEITMEPNVSSLIHVPFFLDTAPIVSFSPHNAFHVDARAFLSPFVKDTATFHHEFTIVLFYNLGLAYHLAAMTGAPGSHRDLARALRCYKIALTVFQQREVLHFEDWHSLLLGLLNNMGHIYCHTFQSEKAKECSGHIEALLATPDTERLSEEECNFFFGALLQTRGFSSVLVAPAA